MPLEIEKKYLLKHLPDNLSDYPYQEIKQGYLPSPAPGSSRRVRQKDDKYIYTEKSGMGIAREENEHEISEEEFTRLWAETGEKRVSKRRYLIPYNSYTIELDVYFENLNGLYTAEVEFPSVEEAENFTPPHWFGEDVSTSEEYRNKTLAEKGLPKDFKPLS
ncbi:MAG: hypothetical protein SCALA702_26010 [Melioribacteraceae bacterium]|nr:MAG: hypothetical protein SCALA702_26010 [Melioribacteraceae bacterium]